MTAYEQSKWNRLAALLLAVAPGLAFAGENPEWLERLQLHAFLSQGYVNTTHNRFMGDSEEGSLDFREAGVNLSLRPSPHWLFSAQLLSRKAGEMSNGSVNLDYGLVDFTPFSSEAWRIGVIGGRFKNPVGLYNDTRDVPFTRPSVFLPQSIYWEKLRDIMLSSDGGQFHGELFHGRHSLLLQLGIGRFTTNENLEWAYLGNDWPGAFENDGLSRVGRLQYEFEEGRVRLALSGIEANLRFEAEPGPPTVGSGKTRIDYWVASFQYNAERWSLTAEYMREPVEWESYLLPTLNGSGQAEGYYLQGTWRATEEWEVLLRYDAAYLDRHDRDGSRQSSLSGLPAHLYFSRIWSLGLTWYITSHMMLRGQFDIADGTALLSARENPDPAAMERHWKLFSLLFSVGF